MTIRLRRHCPAVMLLLALAGCGGADRSPSANALAPSSSSGQVAKTTAGGMTRYAAARAADQMSFGGTSALVSDLSQKGLDAWVTAQMALPATQMSAPTYVKSYSNLDTNADRIAFSYVGNEFFRLTLTAPDQLRLRVTWALLQFVPVNGKAQPYSQVGYFNMLQRNAFGNYGEFLRELTLTPAMGNFLDNHQNRPVSAQCSSCAPNENYARELMQLFTLGVVKLNPDGTTVRNAQGQPIETYTQEDVEELAGALTGWRFAPSTAQLPNSNWTNAGFLMVQESWSGAHDRNAKTVMGTTFAAGKNASQELDIAVAMLMQHQNIAPFVSLRLIQHLVTSNPTPQYLGRVADKFRNNGKGVAGDMKAVIRAILTDPEARRGDTPGSDTTRFGKFREPLLFYTGLLRGLGCTRNLVSKDGSWPVAPPNQSPFNAPSVFSYYLPTDRAPGSNLLAPEQKIVNAQEFTRRLGQVRWTVHDAPANASYCDVESLGRAYSESPKALIDLISLRWFRGAMPPTLRSNLLSLATGSNLSGTPVHIALTLTEYALTTPFYGVIK